MFLNSLGVAAYFSKELNAMVEEKLGSVRARQDRYAKVAALSHVDARIAHLELMLARSALLLEAATEACVSKGLLTREEIRQKADKIELDQLPSFDDTSLQDETPTTPEEYFQQLEQRDRHQAKSHADYLDA